MKRIRQRLLTPAVVLLAAMAAAAARGGIPASPPETVIECDRLEMQGTEKEAVFIFTGGVSVTSDNMRLTCERLEVIAHREADPAATIGAFERFKSLIATTNVHIVQGPREAFCDRAEILPGEDRITLTGNPVVKDEQGYATGPRMVLLRNQRRAIIEGDSGARARIVLPPLKNLGFDEKAPAAEEPAPSPAPAAPPTPATAP